jgi:hypothetical protein
LVRQRLTEVALAIAVMVGVGLLLEYPGPALLLSSLGRTAP